MRRVHIPAKAGGGWVELRDAEDLTMRHKRSIKAAVTAAAGAVQKVQALLPGDLPDDPKEKAKMLASLDMEVLGLSFAEADAMQQIQAAAIVSVVSAWSLDIPIPNMDTVWDLKEPLYEFLSTVADASAAEVDFDPSPDTARPTGRRTGSNGHSSAKVGVRLRPKSPRSTASSSSAV